MRRSHTPFLRALALLLALCTLLLAAGCGSGAAQETPAPVETAAPEATPEPAPEATPEPQPAETPGPAEPVQGQLNLAAVPGLPEDFIMGVDISSLLSEFASGVVYYDFDGEALTDPASFCAFLAQCGITHVRLRVWNDPYDEQGHGYGGGNNGVETTLALAEGCAAADLKLLVDFHLSDFWADPKKQQTPKAWEGMSVEEKAEAAKAFIGDTLEKLQAAGAAVDMVQIGNEITGGVAGEKDYADMCRIFSAGAEAVHAAGARAVIHVTNPEQKNVTGWARILHDNAVDYDILATSYYPYWHGTFENLAQELSAVRETYGKDVMVAETSYAYTLEDTDGSGNTIGEGAATGDAHQPFTVQGQATAIRDLIETVNGAGGLGVFYWEPAWITVGDTTGLEGGALTAQWQANSQKWEEFGSGWAASYASEYDPDDAGRYYGGSAVDNEAFFGPDGRALPSLNVWKYVYTGAVTDSVTVESIEALEKVNVTVGNEIGMPQSVTVHYNNGAVEEPVAWDEAALAAIDTAAPGEYTVTGTVTFSQTPDNGETGREVTAQVVVAAGSLIPDELAAGFESGEGFVVEGAGISAIPATDDPYEGEGSLHWWDTAEQESSVTYAVPIQLTAGSYRFTAKAQGEAGDTVTLEILDGEGNVLFSGEAAELSGWQEWKDPFVDFTLEADTAVQLRMVIHMQPGGWGTLDNMALTAA